MVRTHQLGEAVFRSILPEDIDWKPFSAFPPLARLAVLYRSGLLDVCAALSSRQTAP
jgi:hypothetical protein